jgi:hypothetical protein
MNTRNHVNFLPRLYLTTVTTAILGVLVVIPSITLFAHADNINPNVYPIDSKPYGIPYAEWTAKWDQWFISMPQQTNAADDPTGKFCAVNQNGPVWFLAGTTGGSAERTCTIPTGKAILFPVVNSECSYIENPTAKTESDLISCAKQDNNRATNLQATLDGHKLQQLEKYRVVSPLVEVTFPNNNLFGVAPGHSKMIVDGFYVFLQPLSKGNHELHFSSFTPPASPGGQNYVVDVTYHLKVQ